MKHILFAGLLAASLGSANAYQWNYPAAINTPGANDNGKVVLFDVSHGGT